MKPSAATGHESVQAHHFPIQAMVVVALAILLSACAQSKPVSVGVMLGVGEVNAARLAMDEATATGVATRIVAIYVVAPNTRAAPAIKAAEQFVADGRMIAVVGHGNSAGSLAAAPVYNRNKVVQLSPNSTANLYSNAGPFSYRLVSSDDRQASFLAKKIIAAARGRRVAVLYVNDDYGRGLHRALMNTIPTGAIDVVLDAPHNEGTADVTRRVSAIIDAQPEFIVWLGRGAELARLLPEIRKRLGTIPIFGSDAVATISIPTIDARWNGVSFVDLLDLNADAGMRALRERYRARFGHAPTASEVLAYDAMNVIIAAVRSGARTGPQIQAYLNQLGSKRPAFQGVSGPVVFDENGDVERDYVLTIIGPTR